MSFRIERNDITKIKADAIVNSANPDPCYAGGVDSAIYEAAGVEELLAARRKIGEIERGQAVETPAFGLQAKYIIHTVGPEWMDGLSGEFKTLESCYRNALELAIKLGCSSIAFPLISTGVYGFPKDRALQIALSVIQSFVMENDLQVILVVFDKKAFELSGKVVEDVREYVDSNYVQAAREREYAIDYRGYGRYFVDDLIPGINIPSEGKNVSAEYAGKGSEAMPPAENVAEVKAPKVKIDDLLSSSDKTFQEKLFEIIDQRGLTGPQVYKDYVSKQVFSKIQSDRNYHPNKYTAIALCLSLHLNLEQTLDLMGRAGWTLSPSSKADLVVRGCIMNHEYKVMNINCLLFDFNLPMLENIK